MAWTIAAALGLVGAVPNRPIRSHLSSRQKTVRRRDLRRHHLNAATDAPWARVRQEISEALSRCDPRVMSVLFARLAEPERTWFSTGSGRFGLIARTAAMRCMHLGRRTHFVDEVSAPSIRGGDALFAVSGSGTTSSIVKHAEVARSEGALVLAVTTVANCELVREASGRGTKAMWERHANLQ